MKSNLFKFLILGQILLASSGVSASPSVDPLMIIASKRLSNLGFFGKKFVLEQDDKPKTEHESFYARFEEPVKINGVTFSNNVSIGVENHPATKKSKATDVIAVIRVEEGQSFVYQGVPCMTVALKKGLLQECVLAKDFRFRNFSVPARSHLHFRPSSGSNVKPLFISQLRSDIKVGKQSYKKGQSLKITNKGLTTNFNPLELNRINGGK
jgi:hypothetical protein